MNIMRKVMWVFIACCILKANQALAGDLYPMQEAAGLWHIVDPSSPPLNDQPDNNTTLFRGYRSTEDDNDIAWFKKEIVEKYGFKKNKDNSMWVEQGKFGKELGSPTFKAATERALAFFKRNPDWSVTKSSADFRKTATCLELLYITAARYLLVTHVLWEQSGKKLIACQPMPKHVSKIPPSVCYPEPYGSATCTSDYDVGLVGKDAGILTEKFNNYFETVFGKTSEKVFDTNVYAFSLEYAMPSHFSGLPPNFAVSLAKTENTMKFKMQELVSAYYKVFKYNRNFFTQLRKTAQETLQDTTDFKEWDKKFETLDKQIPLVGDDRLAHNKQYQKFVKAIGETGSGYPDQAGANLGCLAKALLYAAEAYHTRGAIRHVVGGTQMRLYKNLPNLLPMMDLWVSMIENWGESIKEYNHACKGNIILEVCVLKMSKYMWRMLAAMWNLRQRIRVFHVSEESFPSQTVESNMARLVDLSGRNNPEEIMKSWLDSKRRGDTQIPSDQKVVSQFFEKFDCPGVKIGRPFPPQCLVAINNMVDKYNKDLAKMFAKNHRQKFLI